jgi:hypothetical protein
MEGYINGLKVLYMENCWLKIGVLLDKGADIFEIIYKPLNMDVMLKTSKGLSLFLGRNIKKDKLKNYNELYYGGWQDLVPHKCAVNGVINDISASNSSCESWNYKVIKDCKGILSVKFSVKLSSMYIYIEKILTLNETTPEILISEKITNCGQDVLNFAWTHHIAFGGRIINENASIHLPKAVAFNVSAFEKDRKNPIEEYVEPLDKVTSESGNIYDLTKVYPRFKGERIYSIIKDMKGNYASIFNKKSNIGLKLEWDDRVFKYLRYWAQNDEDIYTVALEPSTSCFNSFEDTLEYAMDLIIKPTEEKQSWVKCIFFSRP